MLLSTDTSSWAVFKTSFDANSTFSDVVISGPPIEYGLNETEHVRQLMQWWEAGGQRHFAERVAQDHSNVKSDGNIDSAAKVGPDESKGTPRSNRKPRPSERRRANMTDHDANEIDVEGSVEVQDFGDSSPLLDRTNQRRGSTVSTAPSMSKDKGREFTPRRSARNRRSPSLVHELRDGTKYVDDENQRGGSVVHELRDGATYVDE